MGQRLNLTISYEDKVYVNAYYHWSGYTSSALYLASEANQFMIENEKKYRPLVRAVGALLITGASINQDEYRYMLETYHPDIMDEMREMLTEYEFEIENGNRNDGYVGITTSSVMNTQEYEEARVAIMYGEDNRSESGKMKTTFLVDCFYIIREEDVYEEGEMEERTYNVGQEEFLSFPYVNIAEFTKLVDILHNDDPWAIRIPTTARRKSYRVGVIG